MRRSIILVALLLPSLAAAQGVSRGTVTTQKIDPRTAARYIIWTPPAWTVANASYPATWVAPFNCRLVDVVVAQRTAGTVGTSWSLDVRLADGTTSMLSVVPVATLASGASKTTDVRGDLTLPAGWTRPVVKTDATPDLAKGAVVHLYTTETGAYTVHPGASVALIFEPKM